MKIIIEDENKTICIKRNKKVPLSRIMDDFFRLLLSLGYTRKEIIKIIHRKDSYVNGLEEEIIDLEKSLEKEVQKKDYVFRLIGDKDT